MRLKTEQLPLHGAGSAVRQLVALHLLHKESVAHYHTPGKQEHSGRQLA